MYKKVQIISVFLIWFLCLNCLFFTCAAKEKTAGWKVGIASVIITPEESMWLAGYAAREHPSEGTLHELKAKALAFEDANGKQSVLITTDLLGFPKEISDNIKNSLKKKYGLSKAQIILSSSHTHSGPVLEGSLVDIYQMDNSELEKVNHYSKKLQSQIIDLVGKAIKSKKPANIYSGNGISRFQVNRRNNDEKNLWKQTKLQGPNDYTVSVLKISNKKEKTIAVLFGYSCHPTVLNGYEWSGDYPGFAQIELKKLYPAATALFFQSAGADQNPMPRRKVQMAIQYGKELAAAVECVLEGEMEEITPDLDFTYSEIDLPIINIPTPEDFVKLKEQSKGYEKRWASRINSKIEAGEELRKFYPYPIQIWKLGELPIVVLGGELVSEYALKIRRTLGQKTFVMGYSNDLMGYIPTSQILLEDGYEATTSQKVYGLPGVWAPDIETQILYNTIQQAKELGIKPYTETNFEIPDIQNR